MIDAYGVDPLGVVVVPHGVETALRTDVTPADELRRHYALGDGPVVVYPAVTNPHKNHAFLLDLLRSRWTDPALRLVLIGGAGSAEPAVTACTDRRVCRLGRVPAADRNGLIAMADALVFPSRYEGFGAPLIEAMTLGAPVIAAATACIPEVVAGAGLVLPLEIDAWAGALDEVRARRSELVELGRARAEQFTAARSGAALAGAYAVAVERA
ncbi:MAG: glycosyltransferase [Ilumatobacteraceae bacterium]